MAITRRVVWLVTAAVVAVGAGLWTLPEVVRRVALAQIPKVTGRTASIEDVDLNLFTGRFAIKKLRVAEREGAEAFVELERLDGRLWLPSLVAFDIRLAEIRLGAPSVRLVRTRPAEFNFSDLLALVPASDSASKPSRWTFTVDRLEIHRGQVLVEDRAVSPVADWSLKDLDVILAGITTRAERPPGHAEMRASLGSATIEIRSPTFRLAPIEYTQSVALRGFDLTRVEPYAPADVPTVIKGGTLGVELTIEGKRDRSGAQSAGIKGNVTIEKLALSQAGQPAPFLTIPRLALEIGLVDPFGREVVLTGLQIDGLELRSERDRAGQFDILAAWQAWLEKRAARERTAAAPSPAGPALSAPQWRVRLERMAVKDGRVILADRAVSPGREWRLEQLAVDAAKLSTTPDDPPGSLQLKTRIASSPGASPPATLAVDLGSVRLLPLSASGRLVLTGVDLTTLAQYVPEAAPALASRGTLDVDLNVKAERQRGQAEINLTSASGNIRLADLALTQRGAAAPFLTAPRLTVSIKEADGVARSVRLGVVSLEGVTMRGARDAQGNIDLLALARGAPREPAGAAPAPPATPASGAGGSAPALTTGRAVAVGTWRLSLDRFSLTRGTVTFEDRATSPATTLAITDLDATAERVTWPSSGPATLTASMTMPGGGRTELKAQAVLDPLDAQIRLVTRDAPLEPFQAYFPFPARFLGFLSGDSVNEIKREQDGRLLVASRGTAWGRDLEVRAPGATSPVARLGQIEIRGIDFSWPNYALIERVTLTRPHLQIERDEQGAIVLRKLFEPSPPPASGATPAAAPRTGEPGERKPDETGPGQPKPNLLQTMVLDFREIALEDGYARFIDRTTTPDFSEDISKLTLTIRDLSNTLGRQRTTMSVQALVGGDSALDMRGELSGIGESLRADLVGELRDFRLASANPYTEGLTSWIIQRGRLTTKVHYRIQGDRLIAEHDVNLGGLQVQRARESDEAKRRIGLPLGLAVALLKDSRGNIDLKIPLDGTLSDRKFNWGEAMWTAVKQVILKVLAAPFNAIGRLFRGEAAEEGPQVNPVTFASGSSVISPSMELHLTRVGDVLRRSPYVTLSLTPVVTGADVESLKSQALMARIRQFQQERKIDEFPAAVTAYYREQNLPAEPPASSEQQLARLLEREPMPDGELRELIERRVEATRHALVTTEGIQAERLKIAAPQRALDKRDEGRVEFAIGAE